VAHCAHGAVQRLACDHADGSRVGIIAYQGTAHCGRCVWKSAAGLTCNSLFGEGTQAVRMFTHVGVSVIRINPQKDSFID
jgi:hypothetical protein